MVNAQVIRNYKGGEKMEKPIVKSGDKCWRCGSPDTILFRRSSLRFNKRLRCNQCGAVYEPPLSLISRVAWVMGGLILCGFGVFMIFEPSVDVLASVLTVELNSLISITMLNTTSFAELIRGVISTFKSALIGFLFKTVPAVLGLA